MANYVTSFSIQLLLAPQGFNSAAAKLKGKSKRGQTHTTLAPLSCPLLSKRLLQVINFLLSPLANFLYNVDMAAAVQGGAISKRRKFVADGVFYAELNEFFQRELAEEGYSGVEVRVTPTVTDISMFDLLTTCSCTAESNQFL